MYAVCNLNLRRTYVRRTTCNSLFLLAATWYPLEGTTGYNPKLALQHTNILHHNSTVNIDVDVVDGRT